MSFLGSDLCSLQISHGKSAGSAIWVLVGRAARDADFDVEKSVSALVSQRTNSGCAAMSGDHSVHLDTFRHLIRYGGCKKSCTS